MAGIIDRFMEKHTAFARICRRKLIVLLNSGTLSNIFSCLAVSLAAGLTDIRPGGAAALAVCVIMIAVWIFSAFLGGFLRQWFFIVFAVLYFLMPAGIIMTAADEKGVLYELCGVTALKILSPLSELTGTELIFPALGAAVVCGILFAAGLFIRERAKRSEFYCLLRIESMS